MGGIWRSYDNLPKAVFYLLKGDDILEVVSSRGLGRGCFGGSLVC